MNCLPVYLIKHCLATLGTSERATIQGWGGVEDVLWIDFTLFVRFFDRYYVATIPKSRFEVLDSFLILYGSQLVAIDFGWKIMDSPALQSQVVDLVIHRWLVAVVLSPLTAPSMASWSPLPPPHSHYAPPPPHHYPPPYGHPHSQRGFFLLPQRPPPSSQFTYRVSLSGHSQSQPLQNEAQEMGWSLGLPWIQHCLGTQSLLGLKYDSMPRTAGYSNGPFSSGVKSEH